MKKTGEILKKAREAKDLSLHEISLSLKISNKILKAIEEGDASQLPAKTFLRGFVQSYSNFLHLDTDKVLETFREEMGTTKPKPYLREEAEADESISQSSPANIAAESSAVGAKETPAPVEKPIHDKVTKLETKEPSPESNSEYLKSTKAINSLQKKSHTKTYLGIVSIVVLISFIVFTKQMIDKYSKEAEVPSAEVAQAIDGATPVFIDGNDEALTEIDTPSPVLLSTEAPATTAATTPATTAGETAAPVTAPKDAPVAEKPVAAAAEVKPIEVKPEAKPEVKPEIKPEATGKPVELIVEALEAVDIEYSAPNGSPQKIRLSSEQVHTFKSRSGLNISFSNGGAVNLILNGKDVGIPGDLGKSIKLSY